jgi:anti-sigma regulatory factor (Ser/Thr protein kinase)
MRALTLRLPAEPAAARLLRERLRIWLDEAGADEEPAADVVAACAEAFANAVQHPLRPTCETIDVHGEFRDWTVVLTVHDYGTVQVTPFVSRPGHYGLVLMQVLMDSVEVNRSPDGTTVTLARALALPDPPPLRPVQAG